MIPGPRDSSPRPESHRAERPVHSGCCSVCEVAEPFDADHPLTVQLDAFMPFGTFGACRVQATRPLRRMSGLVLPSHLGARCAQVAPPGSNTGSAGAEGFSATTDGRISWRRHK